MVAAAVVLTNGDLFLLGLSIVLLAPGIVLTGLLLVRPRSWLFLAAGIANSLLTIIAIPAGLLRALANPLADPLYPGVVLSTLSLLLALPAGISGFLRGRWHLPKRSLVDGVRSLHGLAVIAVVGMSLGAMAAGFLAYQHIPAPPGPAEAFDFVPPAQVVILISDSRFQPSAFNVTAAVVTEITVLNEDTTRYTFTYTVNRTTYSHDVFPGGTTRFLVLFSEPGTVPFWSVLPLDPSMMGNITVLQG